MSQHLPFSIVLSLLVFVACGGSHHSMKVTRSHKMLNMPKFDVGACFPESHELGDDAPLEATWVTQQIAECRNLSINESDSDSPLNVRFVAQPDNQVKVVVESEVEDPKFNQCVEKVLAQVKPPISTGQSYDLSLKINPPDRLPIEFSILGTIVGTIRSQALDTCGCLSDYRDAVPPNVTFKFSFDPSTPYPQDLEVVSKNVDPALAQCLQQHLAQISIRKFDEKLSATYKFKFTNSKLINAE